jgi:hypothetical protein
VSEAVLVAPKFDSATEYSYGWSREAKALLEQKSYEVIDYSGRTVGRAEVENALRQNPGVLYVHFDHGSDSAHWGSQTEAVVDLNNVKLLSGREVYCMNCLSAKKLGVEAYKNGALAYWGYVETFTFSTEAVEEFGEFAVSGLKFRLQGETWTESLQHAKDLAKALGQKLVEAGKYIASVILQGDADALVCYTPDNPPESKCIFRKTAIRIFGPKTGWKLPSPFETVKHLFISKRKTLVFLVFLIVSLAILHMFSTWQLDMIACSPVWSSGWSHPNGRYADDYFQCWIWKTSVGTAYDTFFFLNFISFYGTIATFIILLYYTMNTLKRTNSPVEVTSNGKVSMVRKGS